LHDEQPIGVAGIGHCDPGPHEEEPRSVFVGDDVVYLVTAGRVAGVDPDYSVVDVLQPHVEFPQPMVALSRGIVRRLERPERAGIASGYRRQAWLRRRRR
jgi:hypothetical protein